MQPELVEQDVLKNLLKKSFNEPDIPFTTVIGKYSTTLIKDNWFYFLIIILIIVLIIFIISKNENFKQIPTLVASYDSKIRQKKSKIKKLI